MVPMDALRLDDGRVWNGCQSKVQLGYTSSTTGSQPEIKDAEWLLGRSSLYARLVYGRLVTDLQGVEWLLGRRNSLYARLILRLVGGRNQARQMAVEAKQHSRVLVYDRLVTESKDTEWLSRRSSRLPCTPRSQLVSGQI